MPCKRLVFLLLLIIGFFPYSVQASQIAPNPNTGTIDIINDPTAFNSDNPFTNQGTISIDSTSTLTNNTGAQLSNGDFTCCAIVPGTLINNGTVINNGVLSNIYASTVTNNGTLTNNGSLVNSQGGGKVTNAAGATLNNYGNLTSYSNQSLVNAGTLNNFSGGTVETANLSFITNTGRLNNFAGGTLGFLDGGLSNSVGAIVNNFGAMTSLETAITNNGTIKNFGSWGGGDTLITNSIGATITNLGSISLSGGQPINNAGTIVNTGILQLGGLSISNTGTFINTGSMTSGGNSFYGMGNSGTLINVGSIDGLFFSQSAGLTINNGTMTVSPFLASFAIQGGTFMGTGTINGPVVLASGATLAPGTPLTLGTLTINGNLQSSGNLLFRISPVLGQFDVLRINGNAAFTGGTMSFSFLNFSPHIGDSWDFFYATAISGWDTLSFLFNGLGANERAQFSFHDGIETLRIVAVPEPSSIFLMTTALAGIAGWRRLLR
jgi:hypothetical protein